MGATLTALMACSSGPPAQAPAQGPAQPPALRMDTDATVVVPVSVTHRVYVANESSDIVSRVAFTPGGEAVVEKEIPVGLMPSDNDGAHGITVSPDGRFWYLTLAHGTPYGQLWQFHAGPDTLVARGELGLFPATMAISPDGGFLLAANFNLHGDMVPSDISVVHTPTMLELVRIPTCLMPHGSRVSADGAKHYSACMHSDQIVEIDMADFAVSARFLVAPGNERTLGLDDAGSEMRMGVVCSPTWVEPSAVDGRLYVACNKNSEVLEIDTGGALGGAWRVTRRFPTGNAPYNLEATADGRRLLATLKGEQAVAVFDLESGVELGRIDASRPITHGVVASPDSRYAFVTNESVGSIPGTVDVIDIRAMERVATVEVGQQAGGIGYWGGSATLPGSSR